MVKLNIAEKFNVRWSDSLLEASLWYNDRKWIAGRFLNGRGEISYDAYWSATENDRSHWGREVREALYALFNVTSKKQLKDLV